MGMTYFYLPSQQLGNTAGRCKPVQCRHPEEQRLTDLISRQTAGQCNTHRVFFETFPAVALP